jgi:flagellar biosynthetic protein FlhB
MAEQQGAATEAEDKTEEPTQRRLERAREEGETALSSELVKFAALGGATLGAALLGPAAATGFSMAAADLLSGVGEAASWQQLTWSLLAPMLPLTLGVGVLAAATGILATMLQTRFLASGKWLQPKANRLSPLAGVKRIFGRQALEQLARTVLNLAACIAAVWFGVLRHLDEQALPSMAMGPAALAEHLGRVGVDILIAGLTGLAFVALLDLIYVNVSFLRRMRMGRRDIKDEVKEGEGDPHMRARRLQIMRARSQRRALDAVRRATVVITNPTHYAVALVYERGKHRAPKVVAKGTDSFAKRIRDTADENGVPVVSDPPLARALYLVPEEKEIPQEYFAAVAEVIAFVWRLRRGPAR